MAVKRASLFNGIMLIKTYIEVYEAVHETMLELVMATNDSLDGNLIDIDILEGKKGVVPINQSTAVIAGRNMLPLECVVFWELDGFIMKPGWTLLARHANFRNNSEINIRGNGLITTT